MHEAYDRLHESEMQNKFRKIAPMPAGVVYIQRPGEEEKEIRWHFRTMKDLGFTALKGIYPVGDWTVEKIQLIALDEGLVPWWYGQGGWVPITDTLLSELGIGSDLSPKAIREHPKMVEYQRNALEKRIRTAMEIRASDPNGEIPKSSSRAFDPTVGGRGLELSEKGERLFVEWVKRRYDNIDAANLAYNQDHANLAIGGGGPFTDWVDFAERWKQYNHREYRIRRDIFRFKADHALEHIRNTIAAFHAIDPNAPYRAGGELSLFRPQAWWNVDFEGIADVARDTGTFYPSIHFSWHFNHSGNEILKSSYMQAAYMTDNFKGGWSAAWETSGGPQQFDGEQSGDPDMGFTVDAGTLNQFFMSHLAAGFKGFGIWCWSARTAGKEAGEYALLDRHNKVTDRAIAVGGIGKAMQRYRDELWQARKEPMVGVYVSWDNEAIWSAMSDRGRHDFRDRPTQGRIGICNTLIDRNIPFEFVTADDIRNGIAGRYPVIYMPTVLAVNTDVMELLGEYVSEGGRLVMDMPGGWYDEYAQLYSTDVGSVFEKTFGTVIADYQYAGQNRPWSIEGQSLLGSIGVLQPTRSKVVASFENGKPAVTEASFGDGSAVVIGFEAARGAFKSEGEELADLLVEYALEDKLPRYRCKDAIVYRLAAPGADHYFFMNDGPARSVRLSTDFDYASCEDAVSGEKLSIGAKVALDAYSARWLRFAKREGTTR